MTNEHDEISNINQGTDDNQPQQAGNDSGDNSVQKADKEQPVSEQVEVSESETNSDEVRTENDSGEEKKASENELAEKSSDQAGDKSAQNETEPASEAKEEAKVEPVNEQAKEVKPLAAAVAKPPVKKSAKSGEKKWYVVRAISGKENKVKLYIEQEISRLGLSDYVNQVLIPKEKIYQIKAGKKVSKERNYFPGYVLVEANLVGEIPHIIESTTGVIGFLGSKGQPPAPLRTSEVNRILGKVDELADSEEMINVPYVVGETVKVTDGPFNSFSGIIEEVNEEKKKLKVMVKIFGRKTPLELGYLQVEKE